MSSRFSVVIATLDRTAHLRVALASLCRAIPPPREVLVVDAGAGGSARATVDAFAGNAPFDIVHVPSERGLTRQRNRGIDRATGDVVVFLDDDVTVEANVFAELDTAYADPRVVGATGRVVEPADPRLGGARSRLRRLLMGGTPDGTFTRFGYPRRIRGRGAACDVETMPGCFLSARRDAAETVRFDERLTGYALAEDEDFSVRLAQAGRIRYLPGALVYHRNTGFSSRDSRSFNRDVMRNRRYLFRKNFPQTPLARAGFALLALALLAHRAVNRDFRGLRGLVEGAVAPPPAR
jgi:GT2 family glycosyltransferase